MKLRLRGGGEQPQFQTPLEVGATIVAIGAIVKAIKDAVIAFFSLPVPFIAMRVYFFLHGVVLDAYLLNILPLFDEETSDSKRADMTPWAFGGYHPTMPPIPNLAPAHRRFMAENLMYALARAAPFFFYTSVPAMAVCVGSHTVEAITIAWEVRRFEGPPTCLVAQTLMAVFSTGVFLTTYHNPGRVIPGPGTPGPFFFMASCVGLNWLLWLSTLGILASRWQAGEQPASPPSTKKK